MTHLVQILLPLFDNAGNPFAHEKFTRVRNELMVKFNGLTAYVQSPAEGLWQPGDEGIARDQIVIYEVMVTQLDRPWWQAFREELERRFAQHSVIVRATEIQLL